MPGARRSRPAVFLNTPYDAAFERLYLAFEAKDHRLQKSLRDLSGVDVHVHGGTVEGVMRELCKAFIATGWPSHGNSRGESRIQLG